MTADIGSSDGTLSALEVIISKGNPGVVDNELAAVVPVLITSVPLPPSVVLPGGAVVLVVRSGARSARR